MKNWKFYRMLHARGMDVQKLADAIGSNRCHVNKVLLNESGRGHFTRKKLVAHLSREELAELGWDGKGNQSPVISDQKNKNENFQDEAAAVANL